MRLLIFVLCVLFYVPLFGVTALDITPIRNGVVLFGKERLLREQGQATVYAVIDYDGDAFATRIQPLVGRIENCIANLRRDMRPEVQRLLTGRLQRVMRTSPIGHRVRRGLVNFLGHAGKALFGLATEEDIVKLQAGLRAVADQTDVLTTQHNELVGIVNRVGAAQQKQMIKVNELVNKTNILYQQLTSFSSFTSAIIRNLTNEWKHMKLRTNVESIISDLEARYRDFREITYFMHDQKLSCEVGAVTEDLLPKDLLVKISALRRENEVTLPTEWYYRTLRVEAMFRDSVGRLVCKYTVPLLASEPYIAYNVHTYPVYNVNDSFAVRLYHDVYVAIGTQTGELFYPEQCKGIDPVVCHAGLRYDKSRELCVRGLITGSPKQQSYCSISLHKTIDNSQSIKEVTRNKFVIHTPHEHYSYRCPNEKPITGELYHGTYVVEIDPDCLLDTSAWMLEGLTYHEIYHYFNISDIEIPDVPVFNEKNWQTFHALLDGANVIDQLDVPNFNNIPTIPPMHIPFALKKPLYKLWYFWICLIILLILVLMTSYYLFRNGCLSLKTLNDLLSNQDSPVTAISDPNLKPGPVAECSISGST